MVHGKGVKADGVERIAREEGGHAVKQQEP